MAIYFIIENEDLINQRIKIGFSKDPATRIKALQTGNSRKLALMGWINTENNRTYETKLHTKYEQYNVINEWYEINSDIVLNELKSAGTNGYIALQENANVFLGNDNSAIPEFMPPWEWADTDVSDFCPNCGCSCGLSYNENYGGERCLKCGIV